MLPLEDIQGLIIRGYRMDQVSFRFYRVTNFERARIWLKTIIPLVSNAMPWVDKPSTTLSVGFTANGLKAFGISKETLLDFPEEFRGGMSSRASLLGDEGLSDPNRWLFGGNRNEIHMMLICHGVDKLVLEQKVLSLHKGIDIDGIQLVYEKKCEQLPGYVEHFGFRDGISQPPIDGIASANNTIGGGIPINDGWQAIAPGEFLLGYPGENNQMEPVPSPQELTKNGSFAVVRQLYQDVLKFRRYVAEQSTEKDSATLLAAKMVGRWQSGQPLALNSDNDDGLPPGGEGNLNDFRYRDDPSGLKCPRSAHIRRANPRDSLDGLADIDVRRHRILRRGIPYGPQLPIDHYNDDGLERGLMFVAINASISRQFEFVQKQWVGDGEFIGLQHESDPLIGPRRRSNTFTFARRPVRRRLHGLPEFITLRGGEYFFLPSLSGLKMICED